MYTGIHVNMCITKNFFLGNSNEDWKGWVMSPEPSIDTIRGIETTTKRMNFNYHIYLLKIKEKEAKDDFAQDRTGDVLRVKQMP